MKTGTIVPYEGEKPYVFVSYCHKDEEAVLDILCRLQEAGYRLWYDSGIHVGDQWPEIIADHLEKAAVFLAFLSSQSVESHNCRREFNFALIADKPFVTVFLEEMTLTPVMKLQLSTIQAIWKQKIPENEFYRALFDAKAMWICRNGESKKSGSEESGQTQKYQWVLIRRANGDRVVVSHDGFKVGRKTELCDYAIVDNAAVSRVHAEFFLEEGSCFLADQGSKNRSYVNDREVTRDGRVEIHDGDELDIGREIFYVKREERTT